MNERICYRVLPSPKGWDVVFDHTSEPQHYRTFEDAVIAARTAASTRFEVFGRPSCVTIKRADGVEERDIEFG